MGRPFKGTRNGNAIAKMMGEYYQHPVRFPTEREKQMWGEEDINTKSSGRDYGDENDNLFPRNEREYHRVEWDPTAFPGAELGPPLAKPVPDPKLGIGGAPTRATTLPSGAAERKRFPIASGVMDYFPDAIVAIAEISYAGNEQHNPGSPLHWDRAKSGDEADTIQRHFLQRGTWDTDGKRHSAKMAWRTLALLQKEIEDERNQTNGTITDEQFTYRGLGARTQSYGGQPANAIGPQARSVDDRRNQTVPQSREDSGLTPPKRGFGLPRL